MKNIFFSGLLMLVSVLSYGQTYENVGELSEKLGDSFYEIQSNGDVLFKFEEEYGEGILNAKLYDRTRVDVTPVITNLTTGNVGDKKMGINVYSMNLSGLSSNQYVLEVTDAKGKVLKMRIQETNSGSNGG